MIKKFLGEFFQNTTNLIMTPILVLVMSQKGLNINLSVMLVVILSITLITILKLYEKKKTLVEAARKEYVNMSNIIEQNTSNFTLIKLYNNKWNKKNYLKKKIKG